jgi:hypothetical protein
MGRHAGEPIASELEQPSALTQEDPCEQWQRLFEVDHADRQPAVLDRVTTSAAFQILPFVPPLVVEVTEPAREPRVVREIAEHPVLAPPAIAGAEQRCEREHLPVADIFKPVRFGKRLEKALCGAAVGEQRKWDEHQRRDPHRRSHHEQWVTSVSAEEERRQAAEHERVDRGPRVDERAEVGPPVGVGVGWQIFSCGHGRVPPS